MKTIKITDVPTPTTKLCWKQAETMVRCDRKAGHNGKHSWELNAEMLDFIRAQHMSDRPSAPPASSSEPIRDHADVEEHRAAFKHEYGYFPGEAPVKAECEAQHARAEQAEAKLAEKAQEIKRLRWALMEARDLLGAVLEKE